MKTSARWMLPALLICLCLPGLASAQPAGFDCKTRTADNGGRCPIGAGCWEGEWGTCQAKITIGGIPIGTADATATDAEQTDIDIFSVKCACVPSQDPGFSGSVRRAGVFYAGGLLAFCGLMPLVRPKRRTDNDSSDAS